MICADDRVKILDFGVARMVEAEPGSGELPGLTKAGDFIGTPAYASPEQIQGFGVDGRAELYAAALPIADGLVLTEIHHDFEGDTHFPAFERKAWRETQRKPQAGADGLRFQIEVVHAGQTTTQFDRSINPFHDPATRGAQNAELPRIDLAAGDRLRLTMGIGEADSAACDWGYVSKFQLTPLAAAPAATP